jgi:hypothetical protein
LTSSRALEDGGGGDVVACAYGWELKVPSRYSSFFLSGASENCPKNCVYYVRAGDFGGARFSYSFTRFVLVIFYPKVQSGCYFVFGLSWDLLEMI